MYLYTVVEAECFSSMGGGGGVGEACCRLYYCTRYGLDILRLSTCDGIFDQDGLDWVKRLAACPLGPLTRPQRQGRAGGSFSAG